MVSHIHYNPTVLLSYTFPLCNCASMKPWPSITPSKGLYTCTQRPSSSMLPSTGKTIPNPSADTKIRALQGQPLKPKKHAKNHISNLYEVNPCGFLEISCPNSSLWTICGPKGTISNGYSACWRFEGDLASQMQLLFINEGKTCTVLGQEFWRRPAHLARYEVRPAGWKACRLLR